jgi:hypothetical protein
MSKKSRCHVCGHPKGVRNTNQLSKEDKGRVNKRGVQMPAHGPQPKKLACSHECHIVQSM